MKKKKTTQNNKLGESAKRDQTIDMPFEDAVRRLLETPPVKKPKPEKK